MLIKKKNLFLKTFAIAFLFSLTGTLLKLNHFQYSSIFLAIGVISTVIYIIIGIYEVNSSAKMKTSDKVLWTIGFVIFNFLAGLYYLTKRQNIV